MAIYSALRKMKALQTTQKISARMTKISLVFSFSPH